MLCAAKHRLKHRTRTRTSRYPGLRSPVCKFCQGFLFPCALNAKTSPTKRDISKGTTVCVYTCTYSTFALLFSASLFLLHCDVTPIIPSCTNKKKLFLHFLHLRILACDVFLDRLAASDRLDSYHVVFTVLYSRYMDNGHTSVLSDRCYL